MPANEFEKKVQQTLDELRVKPSEEVWSHVARQISNDKRRRRGFIWLTFLFLIIGSAGFWSVDHFYLSHRGSVTSKASNSAQSQNEIPESKTANETARLDDKVGQAKTSIDLNSKKDIEKQNGATVDQHSKTSRNKIQLVSPIEGNNPGNNTKELTNRKGNKNLRKTSPDKTPAHKKSSGHNGSGKYLVGGTVVNNSKNSITQDKVGISKDQGSPVQKEAGDASRQDANANSADSNAISNSGVQDQTSPSAKKIDSSVPKNKVAIVENSKSPAKEKARNKKLWTLGMNGAIGGSGSVNSLLSADKSASDLNYSSSITGPYIQGFFYDSTYLKPSLAWEIGFTLKRQLSKKIALSIGVNYHQFSYHTHVGAFVDSPLAISNALYAISAPGYYRGSGTEEYKNKFGFLEVPVTFAYQFSRNENFPIVGETGLGLGFLLFSNQLKHDFTQNLFYRDEKSLNKVSYNFDLGLKFGILNKSQTPILLGPKFQYDLNDLMQNPGNQKRHLWFLGLEANISLWNFGSTQRPASK